MGVNDVLTFADSHPWVATGAIAICGIIVTVTVTIAIYNKNKRSKIIDYFIMEQVAIPPPGITIDGLKVMFGDEKVDNPRVSMIMFANTGNTSILDTDYDVPIRVLHGAQVEVKYAVIVGGTTGCPDPVLSAEYIEIKPKLFNPGDFEVVQILYDGQAEFDYRCRFKDQTRSMQQLELTVRNAPSEFYKQMIEDIAEMPQPKKTIQVAMLKVRRTVFFE
ncbi:hypothetical protein [Mycolicibacterium vanbaalenii]|nr:hypothetical protein [Mycolicibacterium vanbaalenii]